MDKKVEVINKFGQTLAIFTSEDEETIDRMIDPVVTLTQNSDNVFSFSISEKSQKWEDIKSIENLYIVDGHVYSPLFEDSYTHIKTEDGENLIQVRAYERQKMLEKTFVTAWNSETGFADIDAFMVVILSKGNLPLKNGNKATGVEVIVDPGEYSLGSAGYIMKGLLYGTGWDVGIADVEGYFDFETEQLSVYENLLKVQEMYGGILIFDSMNKLVHLRQESNYISYTGYEVRYKKNLKDMELAIDNKIVTRLYVFGEAGLNIASVNDDKIYLENYTYSNEIFEGIESNTDIYEPDQLKAWGERKLLDLCAPRKVLTTNIAYLTQKEGFEQEKLKLNDSVRVYYDEAEFVAPEGGVEIVSTEVEAQNVNLKKESYITLKGNTEQETIEGEAGSEVIDTNIAVTDVNTEKENYITLQGNIFQKSIAESNILKIDHLPEGDTTYLGITFTNNRDGTLTLNGTSTGWIDLDLNETLLELQSNTNYIFQGCPTGGSLNSYYLRCEVADYGDFNDTGNGVQFSFPEYQTAQAFIEISANQTFTNFVFSPIVYAMDRPIQVVTGENVIKIADKLMLPEEYQRVEYITASGSQYIRTGFAANQDTSVEMKASTTTTSQNAAFYCSRNTMNGAGAYVCFRINNKFRHDYDTQRTENLSSIATNTIYKVYSNKNKLYVNDNLIHTANYTTFQSPYNMILLASHNGGETASLGNYWKGNLYYCKIWDDETLVRDYVPCYRKSDNAIGLYDRVEGIFYTNAGTGNFTKGADIGTAYKVDLRGKNLFDINKFTGLIQNDDGTINTITYVNVSETTTFVDKPSTRYRMSFWNADYTIWTNSSYSVRVDGTWYQNNSGSFTFTTNENGESQIQIGSSAYASAGTQHGYIMIEEQTTGSAASDYEEYISPIELCKIGDYKDYIYKKNGKWYLHKAIGKVALDGSESWNERTNAINVKQFYVSNTLPPIINTTQYCNYFAKYNGSNIYNYGAIGDFAILTNTKQFFGCVNSDLTLENFKTLLSSNNLIVYYVLATPTDTEITSPTLIAQLEALYTAELAGSTTYISTVADDLEPFIDLKYNVVTQMPSPARPSEVKVVGGEQNVTVQGKNLANFPTNANLANTASAIILDLGEDKTVDEITTTFYLNDVIFNNQTVNGAILDYRKNDGTHQYRTPGAFADGTNTMKGRGISNTGTFSRTERNITFRYVTYYNYNGPLQGTGSIQVEMGSPTSFEPYQKSSYAINFGDLELCKINDYQDYVFKNSIENPHYNPNLEINAWYKYSEIGKYKFKSNETGSYQSTFPRFMINFSHNQDATSSIAVQAKSNCLVTGQTATTNNTFGISTNVVYIRNESCTTLAELNQWFDDNDVYLHYILAVPTYEKITDLALTTQLEALYKATLVSPYSHIYSDSGFPIIDLRYNVITPSLYIESNSDLLRVTGVDYPVFNPSSATLTLGDVTLNTNNIFKKISNTTNAYNAGLIPAGSVKITESDGTARPITQEFEVQHTQNATFSYDIRGVNGRVDDVYTLVNENGEDIKKIEEHVDTFEQTAYGLINTLKNRSGNNLLRNSSACFGNEFWTGLVKKEATLDEVHKNFFAKSCFNLQNGTLGQQIAVPNGEYYVGFKYKKLIELANCSVDINGTIVELTSMDYETSDNFIQVNDYSITIKLISDTDDACFVGDIMIVAGNKEKWSPNPNEIYYDSVEIGKGIQVNSNTANTYTRIDADGNRIYNRNSDEIVTELTEYGLSTERVECKEIKGAGILIQEVQDKYGDNQTWITKI